MDRMSDTIPNVALPDDESPVGHTGAFPDSPEGAALFLLCMTVKADRSLASRGSNQPVAAYLLDLYGRVRDGCHRRSAMLVHAYATLAAALATAAPSATAGLALADRERSRAGFFIS